MKRKETVANNRFKIKSKVWLYTGMAGWHFVTIPEKQSDAIRKHFGALKRGWGSLPVVVTLGKTIWKTSIFPDMKGGTYVLPLKSDVRRKEEIAANDVITFSIEIKVR